MLSKSDLFYLLFLFHLCLRCYYSFGRLGNSLVPPQVDSVKSDALVSRSKSDAVNEEAVALAKDFEDNIRVSTKGIYMRHDELKDLRRRIEGRIDVVKDDLVTFERVGEKFFLFFLFTFFSSLAPKTILLPHYINVQICRKSSVEECIFD